MSERPWRPTHRIVFVPADGHASGQAQEWLVKCVHDASSKREDDLLALTMDEWLTGRPPVWRRIAGAWRWHSHPTPSNRPGEVRIERVL